MTSTMAGCMPISIPLRSITMGMYGIDRIVKQYADLSRKTTSLLTAVYYHAVRTVKIWFLRDGLKGYRKKKVSLTCYGKRWETCEIKIAICCTALLDMDTYDLR